MLEITEEDIAKARNELFDLELEKSEPNMTIERLTEIENIIKEIYKKYPILAE